MLAYDYPILGVFWSMFIFFLFFAWLVLLFRVFADIFRSDMRGLAKAVWSIFVIVVPFLGVLIYVIVHGDGMRGRDIADAQRSEAAFRSYVQQTAGSGGVASELTQLSALRDSGAFDPSRIRRPEGEAARQLSFGLDSDPALPQTKDVPPWSTSTCPTTKHSTPPTPVGSRTRRFRRTGCPTTSRCPERCIG